MLPARLAGHKIVHFHSSSTAMGAVSSHTLCWGETVISELTIGEG